MSKSKKKHAVPNIPAAALLRPRLDALWNNPALPQQSDAEIQTVLDELARGVKPDFLLPTLIRAYRSAPASARSRVDALLPNWLSARGHIAALTELIAKGRLAAELREPASAWLKASGVNLILPVSPPADLFYQAYDFDNEFQATTFVLWYVNAKKNRLHGMSVLIDRHPPWDGALKDIMVVPKLDLREMLRRYVDIWADRGEAMTPIKGSAAKTKTLKALGCSRASKIRLPRDLIANRNAFAQFILALPDAPDTPTFTDADWDSLKANGESPESISFNEQRYGYRTRTKDGKEILVLRDPDWDDDF